jgi:hypothetical protein
VAICAREMGKDSASLKISPLASRKRGQRVRRFRFNRYEISLNGASQEPINDALVH